MECRLATPEFPSARHVITEDTWGSKPWCDCGAVRNFAYKRSWLDRLLDRPK